MQQKKTWARLKVAIELVIRQLSGSVLGLWRLPISTRSLVHLPRGLEAIRTVQSLHRTLIRIRVVMSQAAQREIETFLQESPDITAVVLANFAAYWSPKIERLELEHQKGKTQLLIENSGPKGKVRLTLEIWRSFGVLQLDKVETKRNGVSDRDRRDVRS